MTKENIKQLLELLKALQLEYFIYNSNESEEIQNVINLIAQDYEY